MDMKFSAWNIRRLFRAGSDTELAGEYIFFYGKGNEYHELCTGFFMITRII
jgi:hypothetical protein